MIRPFQQPACSIGAGFFIPSFLFLEEPDETGMHANAFIWTNLQKHGGRVAILHNSVRNLPELVEGAV